MSDFTADSDGLLDAAAAVLEGSGFRVLRAVLPPGRPWLLAENDFFAIGILTGSSLHELTVTESLATEAVLKRLGGVEGGAKRWDAYLVLLTSESSREANDRERVGLVYNTRGLRRIVGQGLSPSEESVARVLTLFLPLSDPLESSLGDVGSELAEALAVNGIDQTRAERYVSAYLSRGSLDNV
jgi:hypothetical protein